MLIHHITRAKLKLLTSGPLKTKEFPASRKMFELLNQMWGISTCCYLNGFLQTTKGRTINTHIMLQIRKKRDGSHTVSAGKLYLHVLSCIGDYSIDPSGLVYGKKCKKIHFIFDKAKAALQC